MAKRNRQMKFANRRTFPTPGSIEEFRQPIVRVNLVQPERLHWSSDEALCKNVEAFQVRH